MEQMKNKKERGITLIALVVTIIVLIVLAGISINLIFGTNGVINKAKLSKTLTDQASLNEQIALNELDKKLENYDKYLPENTKENSQEAGTEVKIPEKWYTTTPAYVSTEDGNIVKKEVKVASVTAVATGNGETVPVPKGFYYVGGKINTGVVISDSVDDKNKYANVENGDIPKDLQGNQFVWIPVTEENYKKTEWKLTNGNVARSAIYDTSTSGTELPQIQKYGGFYIARYEAGKGTVKSSSNVEIGSNMQNSGWEYLGWSVNNYKVSGKISSKADEVPYYHADYDTAVQMSNNMYKTEYVQSVLTTGTMWDAMMNFIGSSKVSSTSWGNYLNTQITLDSGKYRKISNDGSEILSNTWNDGKGFKTEAYTRYLLTTGSSEQVKQKNLYDVAGNLWECTQEASFYDYSNVSYRNYMLRGGSFDGNDSDGPACYRGSGTAAYTGANYGFRPALYIK